MSNYRPFSAAALVVFAGAFSFIALPARAAGRVTPSVVAQSRPAPVMSSPPATSPSPSASPQAGPTPIPTPAEPPENPLVTKRVSDTFKAWQSGHIDRKTYSPMAGGAYDDAFVAVVAPDLAAIGPLQSVRYRTASLLLGDVVYRYDVTGASGVVSVLYSLDPSGKTDGVVFTPQIFRSSYLPN